MKKALIVGVVLGLIAYLATMWITAEQDLSKESEDKAGLVTDFNMLKSAYKAQATVLHNSGKAFVEQSKVIVDLQAKQKASEDKIADLERQLQSARASRSQKSPRLLAATTMSADFWRHLSNCECPSGHCEHSGGFFQFKGSTQNKVGWKDGMFDYETERGMAIDWAGRIHPNENTTSGWPVCWNRALRETGG